MDLLKEHHQEKFKKYIFKYAIVKTFQKTFFKATTK